MDSQANISHIKVIHQVPRAPPDNYYNSASSPLLLGPFSSLKKNPSLESVSFPSTGV